MLKKMKGQCLIVIFIICFTSISNALECYVCDRQEGNREKCLNSIVTCEQGHDVCLTNIEWGSTPYWTEGAKKQYYISKKCSTQKECDRMRSGNMPFCIYLWYQDWKCTDCCRGDRCNYFIFSSANTFTVPFGTVITITLISIFRAWIWQ